MAINRRDILRFAAGGGIGAAFTPIPWKLLDDSAIWTQNWGLTPKLPRGEVTTRFSTCTLCPSACGLKARCVAGVPFQLSGVAGHPNSQGALCVAGIDGHHIAYREDRVRQCDLGRVLSALRSDRGPIGILDLRPGRTVSASWREAAARIPGAVYIVPRTAGDALRDITGQAFGLDLGRSKTVLSFGAPLLDGWAAPGRVWAARAGFRLLQAEAVNSRTAMIADEWLSIRPGTGAALALAIGNIMLRDGLAVKDALRGSDIEAYRSLAARFTPEYAGGITGIGPERIVAVAREFSTAAPAVAIGGETAEEQTAVAALNLFSGSVGRRGGFLPWRAETDPAKRLDEVADGSLAVLVVEAAGFAQQPGWAAVKAKLAPGAVVIAHAAFQTGLAGHADYVVPAPAHLEALDEAPAPPDATRGSFALSPALLSKPAGAMDSAEFLARVAETFGIAAPASTEDLLKARAASLHASRRGVVFSYAAGASRPVSEFKTPDELWIALAEGGCWLGEDPAEAPPRTFRLLGSRPGTAERLARTETAQLALVADRWNGSTGEAALAPLMTKVGRESRLRGGALRLNPQTAVGLGLADGGEAVVDTPLGSVAGRVKLAAGVPPGIIEGGTGADAPYAGAPARVRRTS